MKTRWVVRSAHFAVHHSLAPSTSPEEAASETPRNELSTDVEQAFSKSVDNIDPAHRLGFMLPKRHARRAVTRNLLRRQLREGLMPVLPRLPGGDWLVRLVAPWPAQQWTSAASPALTEAVRGEVRELIGRLKPVLP